MSGAWLGRARRSWRSRSIRRALVAPTRPCSGVNAALLANQGPGGAGGKVPGGHKCLPAWPG
eukprot:3872890-Lingulodinium_polyedra.AAC.1